MIELCQPEASRLDIGYRPEGRTAENPPRFSFMSEPQAQEYCLEIATTPEFDREVWSYALPLNFFTPDMVFAPGDYYWRYAVQKNGKRESAWSTVRQFEIRGDEAKTPLPSRETRYQSALAAHPRLWMGPQKLKEMREQIQNNPEQYRFGEFLQYAVSPYENQSFKQEPPENPDRNDPKKWHNAIWRKSYSYAQEALYKIKHLAIAGKLSDNAGLLEKAKQSLLEIAAWDPEGTTSEPYNDEAAFRVLRALAWGYDWLYDQMEEEERRTVRDRMLCRADQVFQRDVVMAKIHQTPYESHPVRSLSMVLIPCGIALLGDVPEAEEWLNYSLEYLACLYSPWGGEDGGWAEGGAYWTTGMASVVEGLDLVQRYLGIDLLQRPFFQHTGDFILHCYSPKQIFASFCDQSNLGNVPPLKTGFLMRQFAAITGNPLYQWYYDQMLPWDTESFSAFYNYGWWNFYFDEFAYLCDGKIVPAKAPTDAPQIKWFHDIGWVAMHSGMSQEDNHITLLLKSSPYGCISHSHADQNGFILHAYGEPMAIESGYYVAYGSDMHQNWRRQTKSTNNILVNGVGQYAKFVETGQEVKRKQLEASGRIIDAGDNGQVLYAVADATQAYRETVPELKRYQREIYFVDGAYFVIRDVVELEKELPLQWLLHSLRPFECGDNQAVMHGEKADMRVEFLTGGMHISQTDAFDAQIRPEETEGKPNQWHLCAQTAPAKQHEIVTLVIPEKRGEAKPVTVTKQDGKFKCCYKNEFQLEGKGKKV